MKPADVRAVSETERRRRRARARAALVAAVACLGLAGTAQVLLALVARPVVGG